MRHDSRFRAVIATSAIGLTACGGADLDAVSERACDRIGITLRSAVAEDDIIEKAAAQEGLDSEDYLDAYIAVQQRCGYLYQDYQEALIVKSGSRPEVSPTPTPTYVPTSEDCNMRRGTISGNDLFTKEEQESLIAGINVDCKGL